MADDGDRPAVEVADAGHDRAVVERGRDRRGARTSRRGSAPRSPACTGARGAGRARPSARSPRPARSCAAARAAAAAARARRKASCPRRSLHARELGQPVAEAELGVGASRPGIANRRSSPPSVGRSSAAGDDRVDVAEAEVRLGEAEVVGKLLARRLCDDARACERRSARRARRGGRRRAMAKLASTPPVVGCATTETAPRRRPAAPRPRRPSSASASARGSPPACARRPKPKPRRAAGRRSGGVLAGARELLADDAPHRAAHEREVHHREAARVLLDRSGAGDDRVAEPRLQLGLGEPLGVRTKVEELERVGGAELGPSSSKEPASSKLAYALGCAHGEVVPAVLADAQVLGRARRRGSGTRRTGRCSGAASPASLRLGSLVLDRDVDAVGDDIDGILEPADAQPGPRRANPRTCRARRRGETGDARGPRAGPPGRVGDDRATSAGGGPPAPA